LILKKEILEKRYSDGYYISCYDKEDLVKQTGLTAKQVCNWFQQRRMKSRRDARRNFYENNEK